MSADSRDSGVAAVRDAVWGVVAPGFANRSVAIEAAWVNAAALAPGEIDEAGQARVVDELRAQRTAELSSLPPTREPSDDVRVELAFENLRANGLIAEMDCAWGLSDGADYCFQLAYEQDAAGYAFFHQQDSQLLGYRPASLWIAFEAMAIEGGPPDSVDQIERTTRVGVKVVEALVAQDLRVRWDGSPATRIEVYDLDWRRPIPNE